MQAYIFNRSGSENLGDQLIGNVLCAEIEKAGISCITNVIYKVPSRRIERYFVHLRSYLGDIRQISSSDITIIGGGNLVMDSHGLSWALHQSWLGVWCRIFQKRYYYLCVGSNPLRSKIAKLLYKFALGNATKISVRDSGTKDYLQELTERHDIQLDFDPVLMISTAHASAKSTSNRVGICPIQLNYESIGIEDVKYEKYVNLQVALIEKLLSVGKEVFLFLNDPMVDRQVFLDISDGVPKNLDGFHAIETFPTLSNYLDFVSSLEFLFTARMHAAICALSYGIPCIGFGWQPKMRYLFADNGLRGYFNMLEELDSNDQVEKSMQDLFELSEQIGNSHVKLPRRQLDLLAFFA